MRIHSSRSAKLQGLVIIKIIWKKHEKLHTFYELVNENKGDDQTALITKRNN